MPRPKQKPRQKAGQQRRSTFEAADLLALVARLDAAVTKAPKPYDRRDSQHDVLFALLMQRVDYLQAHRKIYLQVFDSLQESPALMRALVPAVFRSLKKMLARADLPETPAYATGVMLVYAATVLTWRNDSSADLAKTMRVCDNAIAILEKVSTLLSGNIISDAVSVARRR